MTVYIYRALRGRKGRAIEGKCILSLFTCSEGGDRPRREREGGDRPERNDGPEPEFAPAFLTRDED